MIPGVFLLLIMVIILWLVLYGFYIGFIYGYVDYFFYPADFEIDGFYIEIGQRFYSLPFER